MAKLKKIPKFKNEDEEREFWASHDTTEYFDTSKALGVRFVNLKPSARSVTLRMPESLLHEIKVLAHKRDVPYQSLMKVLLAQKLKEEMRAYQV